MANSSNVKTPEPAAFVHQFSNADKTKTILVEIWPPVFETNRDCWTCSFRIDGFRAGITSSISSDNFVGATINAAEVVRNFFYEQGEYFDSDIGPPESLFPRRIPIQYGLKFYYKVDQVVKTEIEKEETVLSNRRAAKDES
jgi:hypothetical protein